MLEPALSWPLCIVLGSLVLAKHLIHVALNLTT